MTKKLLKTIALFFVLNSVASAGWWWFYTEINESASRTMDLRSEIALLETKQKDIRTLSETLQEVADQKSVIEDVFVNEKTLVIFIEELEKIASVSGTDLKITSASLPASKGNDGPVFNLSVEGSFGRLLKFATILEKMNYQIKINSLRFATFADGLWSVQVRLNLLSFSQ